MNMQAATENLAPLLSKYDVFGPRYTSYPTALQFSEAFTEADYRQQALASNQLLIPRPLSIYLHVPFCKSLCYYCGCHKIITHKAHLADEYLDKLYQELELHAQCYEPDRLLQQIHFGGGTPTFLKPSRLREVLEVVAQCFHLGLPDSLEISIEIDPRSITAAEMQELTAIGFNRISIGVQDFDPLVQQAINRVQSKEQVEAVIQSARTNQVNSVSLDIIYGLPKQTRAGFSRTLDEIIRIRPERIALYNYAHMPQKIPAQRLINSSDLPTTAEKLAMFTDSIQRLTDAGYVYIGMDHFALPKDSLAQALFKGGLQRNFQGYSTHADCDVIGIGVSAISRINNSYSQNVSEISAYKTALARGKLPVQRGVTLSADDRIRADLIQKIMCEGEISFHDFSIEHDVFFQGYFRDELSSLYELSNDGLVSLSKQGFQVTPKGRLFLRNIAMHFDAYFKQTALQNTAQPRYSRTL